jgi:hypothetical protein
MGNSDVLLVQCPDRKGPGCHHRGLHLSLRRQHSALRTAPGRSRTLRNVRIEHDAELRAGRVRFARLTPHGGENPLL